MISSICASMLRDKSAVIDRFHNMNIINDWLIVILAVVLVLMGLPLMCFRSSSTNLRWKAQSVKVIRLALTISSVFVISLLLFSYVHSWGIAQLVIMCDLRWLLLFLMMMMILTSLTTLAPLSLHYLLEASEIWYMSQLLLSSEFSIVHFIELNFCQVFL